MTYAANNAVDFASIARELGVTQTQSQITGLGDAKALVPAEVQARMQRQGNAFLQRPALNGATVDREGLNNNYGVEPVMYYSVFPSQEQVQQYLFQGAAAVALIGGLIATSVAVS